MNSITDELDRFVPEEHVQEIAEVAYSYWESRGRENGHDVEDWLAAEQEVKRRRDTPRVERQASAA
jgi:hypothetical protein